MKLFVDIHDEQLTNNGDKLKWKVPARYKVKVFSSRGQWNRLPGKVLQSPSSKIFKTWLDKALTTLA